MIDLAEIARKLGVERLTHGSRLPSKREAIRSAVDAIAAQLPAKGLAVHRPRLAVELAVARLQHLETAYQARMRELDVFDRLLDEASPFLTREELTAWGEDVAAVRRANTTACARLARAKKRLTAKLARSQ